MYPNDPKMIELAGLFTVAHNCFKILTSTKQYDPVDKFKSALEVNLNEQLEELSKMWRYMETMKFSGRPRFNKGIIIAIKAAIGLQADLARDYNIPTFQTSHMTQDFLESFFSVIRGMGSANNNPDTFLFLHRVKAYITQKILEDDDY